MDVFFIILDIRISTLSTCGQVDEWMGFIIILLLV